MGRSLSFADLVVIAKEFYPIPFRTRPSKPSASMVLRLKPRESRTLPGLPRAEIQETRQHNSRKPRRRNPAGLFVGALVRPGLASRLGARRCGVRHSNRSSHYAVASDGPICPATPVVPHPANTI